MVNREEFGEGVRRFLIVLGIAAYAALLLYVVQGIYGCTSTPEMAGLNDEEVRILCEEECIGPAIAIFEPEEQKVRCLCVRVDPPHGETF